MQGEGLPTQEQSSKQTRLAIPSSRRRGGDEGVWPVPERLQGRGLATACQPLHNWRAAEAPVFLKVSSCFPDLHLWVRLRLNSLTRKDGTESVDSRL